MKVALGLKAHSGWAALVAIGKSGGELQVVDRRRIELVDHVWAKAPYHAAEEIAPEKARALVKRAIEEAYRVAEKALRAAKACGLRLVPVPEKTLSADASTLQRIAALGKSVGAPWGKDQKTAALAAIKAQAAK